MKEPKLISNIDELLNLGKAQIVTITLIELPKETWRTEEKRQTQIGVAGKRFEEKQQIVPVIAHVCEWLGFLLARLRQGIQEWKINMTKDQFIYEVNVCKKHIENALIDYN